MLNQQSLQQLQDILEQFSDLSNLTDSEQQKLHNLLFDAGLPEPGALINTQT